MYTKYNFCYLSNVFLHPENEQENVYQVILCSADFALIAIQSVTLERLREIEQKGDMRQNFSLGEGYLKCYPVNTYNLIDIKTDEEPVIIRDLDNKDYTYTFFNLVHDGLKRDWYLVAKWDLNEECTEESTYHRFYDIKVSRSTMSCFFRAKQKSCIKNINLVSVKSKYDDAVGFEVESLAPSPITIALPESDLGYIRVPYELVSENIEIYGKNYCEICIKEIPLDDENPVASPNLVAKALAVSNRMTDTINVLSDCQKIFYNNLNKQQEPELNWAGSGNTRKGEPGIYFKTEEKSLQQEDRNWIIETAFKEILPKAKGSAEQCLQLINAYRYDALRANLLHVVCMLVLSAKEPHSLLKNTQDYLSEFKKNNVAAMMYLYHVRLAWLDYDLNIKNASLDLYNSDELVNIMIEEIE